MDQPVLVDSSVWIQFFRNGGMPDLVRLIEEDLICTNQLILTELLPSLSLLNSKQAIEGLNAIVQIPLSIDWTLIRKYQEVNLAHGINNVGIPDLIIMQQVIENKLTLYSFDKHFRLMNKQFKFEMF
jgi:predicted nucleic acid-binding protein